MLLHQRLWFLIVALAMATTSVNAETAPAQPPGGGLCYILTMCLPRNLPDGPPNGPDGKPIVAPDGKKTEWRCSDYLSDLEPGWINPVPLTGTPNHTSQVTDDPPLYTVKPKQCGNIEYYSSAQKKFVPFFFSPGRDIPCGYYEPDEKCTKTPPPPPKF